MIKYHFLWTCPTDPWYIICSKLHAVERRRKYIGIILLDIFLQPPMIVAEWRRSYIYWSLFFWFLFLKLLLNLFYNMIVTRSQLENLSKGELIARLLQVENIEDKLNHLNKWFDDFLGKYNEIHSELQVSKNSS